MTSTWSTFGRLVFVWLPSVQLRRFVLQTVCGFFVVRAGLRAFYGVWASLRDCSTAACRSANLAGTGGVKRLSFAYFSLPLQRKVGAAPHRGDASKPIRNRGRQRE
ncbi:hypothetical protein PSAB6_160080 [Paraburkholderia sabiae]|nr:hypothetical protein PSAB6_160080 [Paraburkholderia sabiae]